MGVVATDAVHDAEQYLLDATKHIQSSRDSEIEILKLGCAYRRVCWAKGALERAFAERGEKVP